MRFDFNTFGWWMVVLVIWELFWKGLALWKSARSNQKNWFVALFIFNTLGILPIIYLQFFQKRHK